MLPPTTIRPSKKLRTAGTKANADSRPVWPPAPAHTSASPSTCVAAALRASATSLTSAITSPPYVCTRSTTGAGLPSAVITIGGR